MSEHFLVVVRHDGKEDIPLYLCDNQGDADRFASALLDAGEGLPDWMDVYREQIANFKSVHVICFSNTGMPTMGWDAATREKF